MGKYGNHQAQNVVTYAYRRWLFTRSSNCKALARKILVFWISRLGKVVTYQRWSQSWRFDCMIFIVCCQVGNLLFSI